MIACDLCWRRCTIAPGEAGWCRYRENRDGRMHLKAHGVLSRGQRLQLGYGGGIRTFHPGAPTLAIGGLYCTARCSFCTSEHVVWNPDKVEWYGGREGARGRTGGWDSARALLDPGGAIWFAQEIGCRIIEFAENEPMLTMEFTLDTARRAKAAGMHTVLLTNGFSTLEAIDLLAPYIDAVELGVKGALDPEFYRRWMRSDGAVPHVQASAAAWRAAGVYLVIADLVATAHMQPDGPHQDALDRFYHWIAESLGPHTPVLQGHLHPPTLLERDHFWLTRKGAETDRYKARCGNAQATAKAHGLHYTHRSLLGDVITCHQCATPLLQMFCAGCAWEPCAMHLTGCVCWRHTQHLDPVDHRGGRCRTCGASVPIVVAADGQVMLDRITIADVARTMQATYPFLKRNR